MRHTPNGSAYSRHTHRIHPGQRLHHALTELDTAVEVALADGADPAEIAEVIYTSLNMLVDRLRQISRPVTAGCDK
jgi:hypothetical protein